MAHHPDVARELSHQSVTAALLIEAAHASLPVSTTPIILCCHNLDDSPDEGYLMTTPPKPDSPLEREMHNFVLYSKGHYAQRDLMTDLTTLVATRADIAPHHVRSIDIVNVLVEEVVTQWLAQPESGHRITDFLLRFRSELLHASAPTTPTQLDEILIRHCLGYFSGRKVYDGTHVLLEIGEPDPTVLPLSDSHANQTSPELATLTKDTKRKEVNT